MFCTFCGKTIDDDSKFCVYCGRKFDDVVVVHGPGMSGDTGTGNSQFQAAVCPCCTAPLRLDLSKCEYCGTAYVRNLPKQAPPAQVVPQQIQIVAQLPSQYANANSQMYNNMMNYNNQMNQQLMAQNYQAQQLANAQITAAAIRGGAEITSAALRGGALRSGAKLASGLLFHRFF